MTNDDNNSNEPLNQNDEFKVIFPGVEFLNTKIKPTFNKRSTDMELGHLNGCHGET